MERVKDHREAWSLHGEKCWPVCKKSCEIAGCSGESRTLDILLVLSMEELLVEGTALG